MYTALINCGTIVSGNIHAPISTGTTILLHEGKISAIGDSTILDNLDITQTIDVQKATVIPGLIDTHVHTVIGDYSPRQQSFNFLEGFVHGGVTSIISAGEVHTPGRPTDPAGVKALAILAHKAYEKFRPLGLKVHGGALILEKGLTKKDFEEVREAGVWLVGEVGLGSVKEVDDAKPMVEWAKELGMKVAMHTGGISIPGSSIVTAQMVMDVSPTISSHTNGGPTSIPKEEVEKLINETDLPLEIVQCGNPKMADFIVRELQKRGELSRLSIGTDSPSGSGILSLGILRTIAQLASTSAIPAAQLIACATGNSADLFGLNTSKIEVGREADLVILDSPIGSVGRDALEALEEGDLPGISMVLIDGKVQLHKSKNTPPPINQAHIN